MCVYERERVKGETKRGREGGGESERGEREREREREGGRGFVCALRACRYAAISGARGDFLLGLLNQFTGINMQVTHAPFLHYACMHARGRMCMACAP